MTARGHARSWRTALAAAALIGAPVAAAVASSAEPSRPAARTIADSTIQWPGLNELGRVLFLRDYNTRIVVIGTTLLGVAAGVIGTFAYLRKRALMGDALSHATLPGIAVAFILLGTKSLPLLLIGAAVSGVVGVIAVIALRAVPRIREDAAIGIVLSVFFGFGMVLFSYVQQMKTGNEAGLAGFIYGKAAAMIARDAWLIAGAAALVVLVTAALFKEFRLVCFDAPYGAALGYPVVLVDLLMMFLVVLTTVVGLQAVGLILIVALLIIPAAAARFWTDRLVTMTVIAGLFGAMSGYFGSACSALLPRLPTGAVIVLWAGTMFLMSMFAAPRRGIVAAAIRRWRVRGNVALEHVLRALAEIEEARGARTVVSRSDLLTLRRWPSWELRRGLRDARRGGRIERVAPDGVRLSETGREEAGRLLRYHRLWELYLIRHADSVVAHVDGDADLLEHVLSPAMARELELMLVDVDSIPPSPHPAIATAQRLNRRPAT